jgi:hypothetical protein
MNLAGFSVREKQVFNAILDGVAGDKAIAAKPASTRPRALAPHNYPSKISQISPFA